MDTELEDSGGGAGRFTPCGKRAKTLPKVLVLHFPWK